MSEESQQTLPFGASVALVIVVFLASLGVLARGCAEARAIDLAACADACGERGVATTSGGDRVACVCR